MASAFQTLSPYIDTNEAVRIPQREAFEALRNHANGLDSDEREVGIVLPVGCGKSGCIAITPFAYKSSRALVVAPGLNIAAQLGRDFDPTNASMFYQKCSILVEPPFPEPVEIRGAAVNKGDLDAADVVITNIQQLQGEKNKWLNQLPEDFFDLIIFDEGHHSVAATWDNLKKKFPGARIVNFSATPVRADGQIMAGRVLYSFSIFRAIQAGYVKRLKALQLNPKTLRYVRREDGQEIEVNLEEVKRLGEEEADFRRSIVTSAETLNTIVDASIRELQKLRGQSGEARLKIIASALNYSHCAQIVEAYRSKGLRADYVHSQEDSAANAKVLGRLDAHELDVIVQVRKLGEGFDHPYLAVAAVFSIFSNLSPFVQFVGRIMRVIVQNDPGHALNQGVVVFHAGANVARQWGDFQNFTQADQEYFQQLLPLEGVDPEDHAGSREYWPGLPDGDMLEVRAQSDVLLEEIPLLEDDAAIAALRVLQERGYTPDQVSDAYKSLKPVPTTKVKIRQAARTSLDVKVKTDSARILASRGINPGGYDLDRLKSGKTNLIVVKAAIDKAINKFAGIGAGQRSELNQEQLNAIEKNYHELVKQVIEEVLNGKA